MIIVHLQPTFSDSAMQGVLSDSLAPTHDGKQRKISPKSSPKTLQFSAKIFSKFSQKVSEKARQFDCFRGSVAKPSTAQKRVDRQQAIAQLLKSRELSDWDINNQKKFSPRQQKCLSRIAAKGGVA